MYAGRLSLIFFFILSFFGLSCHAQFSDININHLVVFGDSYTSDGTDSINGPKWVRQLASAWSNTTLLNYAVGGALCNDTSAYTASHSSVEKQATEYLQNNTPFDPNTTIYSIFVGINDMVNGISAPDVVTCIHSEMMRLNQQVQGTHFLIFNMVPFHRSPHILLDNTVSQSQQWIQQFNQLLNTTLAQLQGFDIVLINNFNIVSNVLDNPTSFGITQNITDYYLRTHTRSSPNMDQEANQYAWFDITHVTNIIHQQITKSIIDQHPFHSIPLAGSPSSSPSPPSSAAIAFSPRGVMVPNWIVAVIVCIFALF